MRQKLMAILFRGYPQGFESLCFTQTFYNFSFYGLKSIFVLYIIAQLSVPETVAISLFATLMALSYATAIIGGWVADKGFGIKKTIILGGLLQALGISCLMVPIHDLCFLALALISLGSGFFKPNLSTSVGLLFHDPQDTQKDKAYSTFYMVMNFGSFIGPLLCGFISKTYGGYYNSLVLIVVTLIGGIYFFYQKIDFKQVKEGSSRDNFFVSHTFLGLFIILILGTLYFLFKFHDSFNHLMSAIAVGSLFYLSKIFYQCNQKERKDIVHIILYIILFALFCSLFEQAGSSLMLFFSKVVERRIFGIDVPPATLLSLGPIFVLFLSPLLILFWEKILERKKTMDGFIKVAIGFLLTGLSFLILVLGCYQTDHLVSLGWVVGAILIQTLGELWIVPIGYSSISKLAPPRFRSLMMSFWLMAIAYGHYLGGFIAEFSVNESSIPESSLAHYQSFFLNLSIMPCGIGILLFLHYYLKQSRGIVKKNESIHSGKAV